jgi:hypothetical protein
VEGVAPDVLASRLIAEELPRLVSDLLRSDVDLGGGPGRRTAVGMERKDE